MPPRAGRSLFDALVDAQRLWPDRPGTITDGDHRTLDRPHLIGAALALGRALARLTGPGERVGVMLPTSVGGVVTVYALLSAARVPAMLNFTGGRATLEPACRLAGVCTVLTSRQFLKRADLEHLATALEGCARLVWLEDVRESLTPLDKAAAVLGRRFPALYAAKVPADSPAVVLFTSGTEGEPKGVALTHDNILSNTDQVMAALPILPNDIFFNPLPIFHSYGLSSGTFLPISLGHPLVLHPSPLQAKTIVQRIAETKATILLATDTFVRQYIRSADDDALGSLRYAVCGAERVRPETRAAAEKRFGFRVVEGYGVTETAPVLACNHPDDIRDGSVGRLMPGVKARIEPVEGLGGEGGRLLVRGPNIMAGYLVPGRPDALDPPPGGWHDTGDIVSIDAEGFVRIRGRLKRFAKIGGERVSLTIPEACAFALWPDSMHAAVAVPDPNKGETIVLVTEFDGATIDALRTYAQRVGYPEISVPRRIVPVPELPLLGTGKINYPAVQRLAGTSTPLAPSAA